MPPHSSPIYRGWNRVMLSITRSSSRSLGNVDITVARVSTRSDGPALQLPVEFVEAILIARVSSMLSAPCDRRRAPPPKSTERCAAPFSAIDTYSKLAASQVGRRDGCPGTNSPFRCMGARWLFRVRQRFPGGRLIATRSRATRRQLEPARRAHVRNWCARGSSQSGPGISWVDSASKFLFLSNTENRFSAIGPVDRARALYNS